MHAGVVTAAFFFASVWSHMPRRLSVLLGQPRTASARVTPLQLISYLACRNAQFVVISLRNNMFELADHLVGICKPQNCTRAVPLNPHKFVVGPSGAGPAAEAPAAEQQRPLLQQARA